LVLIIDSREVKDKQEQYFFESRLSEKHGITCMNANLPIGDFAWLYNGQILDYIV
jgi:ERCC4-type nuclease